VRQFSIVKACATLIRDGIFDRKTASEPAARHLDGENRAAVEREGIFRSQSRQALSFPAVLRGRGDLAYGKQAPVLLLFPRRNHGDSR